MLSNTKVKTLFFALFIVLLFHCCKETPKIDAAHAFTNDLIEETSPYLLQHAHNPVNWQAWRPEVLKEAEEQGKLILLSIGYSSCHWCHVMEEETFEDEEVAKMMNENFINIKVDREELPDVDHVYQTAIQLLGKPGGWPLNVIALPNGKPLHLGTYHSKNQWNQVLTGIHKMYTDDAIKANAYADGLAAGIQEENFLKLSSDHERLTEAVLMSGVEKWKQKWDLELGGNQGNEKRMLPSSLDFLLDYAIQTNDDETLAHVKNTLDKMANGGIYDHIGGGIYRYSTDPKWKVPHFEKMLYDNAQLIGLYSKAFSVFQEPSYKTMVFETIAFLEREMKHSEGAYYATLDADSDGEEGKFYVWTIKELQAVLGEDFPLFSAYFNIDEANVWENDTYVLYKNGTESDFLTAHEIGQKDFNALKSIWKKKLLTARSTRVRPNIDDKIISSWNALLIDGLVAAYNTFGEAEFLKRAIAIHDFIQSKSYTKGHLVHSYKEGSKRTEGFLEDYAFLAHASLKLYGATLDTKYLDFSATLVNTAQEGFSDVASGMFRFNSDQALISSIIKTDDGPIPSPNSVMAHTLFQLGHIDYKPEYSDRSKTMLTTLLPRVTEFTDGYANWGKLLLNVVYPYYEIAVVGENAEQLMAELYKKHVPNTLIVGSKTASEAPLFKERFVAGDTYIYVCRDRACKLPVETVDEAMRQLQNF